MALAAATYRSTKTFPVDNRYRMTSQLLRAVASVPANIAEGHARGTRKDYARFVATARGSLAETDTFLQLALDVGLATAADCQIAVGLVDEVGRMLNSLLVCLRGSENEKTNETRNTLQHLP